ncbi:putative permease [Corallococcus macrosporus]|uniref:Putative permease n=2 Tax=Myxococcaceae TaxID=31 RepID=F8CAV6_MYXFH|nr:putative permease [Corallococcus macrosporus]
MALELQRSRAFMSQLLQDVRLSLRRMRREAAFTLVIITTLALAIGATTAVFSAVYQVLLRPLPYQAPEQLVTLYQSTPQRERLGVSLKSLQAWRERAFSFQGLEGLSIRDITLAADGELERVRAGRATAGLFSLLGVRPLLGQDFRADLDGTGLILSHALWQRRFGGRPDVVGQTVMVDEQLHTVVGVLPPGFRFAPDVEAWKPLALSAEESAGGVWLRVVGRLRDGVSAEQARTELSSLGAALVREPDFAEEPSGVRLLPLHAQVVEGSQERLWLLAGVVGLVLLVACANVANLLLARASAREREVSVRAALGAGRGRLVRQFLVESGMLALVGGAAGLVLAMWGVDLLRALMPPQFVGAEGLHLEPHLLAIALVLSVLTSLLFGLIPALRVSRADARGALGGLRGGAGATRREGGRVVLVVAQVALALIPLVGAGLMLRTLHALSAVPLGFNPQGVTVVDLSLPSTKYRDEAAQRALFSTLLERVRELPGVTSAGMSSTVPLWGRNGLAPVLLPGEPESTADTRELVMFRTTSDGYFDTLGIPLKDGRAIETWDGPGTAPVVVVNETFARRYFPGRSAVGQRVRLMLDGETFREIVGVVGDVQHDSLEAPPAPEAFVPMGQLWGLHMLLTVRATQDSAALAPVLREQLRAVAPELPSASVRSLASVVDASLGHTKVLSSLLVALAVLGLVLAGVGLYGVLSYSVSQRTRELGIRIALGATGQQLVWRVVGQGLRMAAAGVALGLCGAAVLARGLSSVLYGVSAFDVVTFAAVPALLAGVALLASWLPARRVTRVPPHEALRSDG